MLPVVPKNNNHLEKFSTNDQLNEYAIKIRQEISLKERDVNLSKNLETKTISEIEADDTIPQMQLIIITREVILKTARTLKYAEKMDDQTANQLASDLLETFKNESIEDIILMFKWVRQGKCGETRGRLDADTINSVIIPTYLDYKSELREKQYQRKKFSKSNEPISPEAVEKFSQLSAQLSMNRMDKVENKKPSINHHEIYIHNLKNRLPYYTLQQLKESEREMLKQDTFKDALILVRNEIKKRT